MKTQATSVLNTPELGNGEVETWAKTTRMGPMIHTKFMFLMNARFRSRTLQYFLRKSDRIKIKPSKKTSKNQLIVQAIKYLTSSAFQQQRQDTDCDREGT